MARRPWPLAVLLLLLMPLAGAEVSTAEQRLNLVCLSGDCTLSNEFAGDSTLSKEERTASPLQPVTVRLEFEMRPDQRMVALLPTVLESMEIDLRVEEDLSGFTRPDLHVDLVLGPSVNDWVLSPPQSNLVEQPPYRLSNAELDLSQGRILKAGDPVLLRLEFDISQPVTWTLHLGGDSGFDLPVTWSIDAEAANVDEPTSLSEPRRVNLLEDTTIGGLMGADVDCYTFDVEEALDSLTVVMAWASTPIEVEQALGVPDLWDAEGRSEDAPEVRTRYEGEAVIEELRWIEPRAGEHTLCWTGQADRYQAYAFSGRQSMQGIGSTTPEEFTGDATWEGGIAHAGRLEQSSGPSGAGVFTMGVAAVGILLALGAYLMPLSSPWLPRFLLPLGMVLLLFGGIISPAVGISNETPNPGEDTFEEVLDKRIDRIVQGIRNGDEGAYGPQWYGGFLGVTEGERVQFSLTISAAHPLGDGRWQIQAEELEAVDLDRRVFGELDQGMIDEEDEVRFILRAGRLMALDLLMLEALLVVDEKPRGSVLHVDWTMASAPGLGAQTSPAWTTRPDTVSAEDWADLTAAVQPELLSVSFCDCGIDAMELSVRPSEVTGNDLVTPGGLVASDGLIPHDFWIAVIGLFILGSAAYVESARRAEAMDIAGEYFDDFTPLR